MTVRVVHWTTGNVGKRAVRAIAAYPGLELVGCDTFSADKIGRDVGELAGIDPIGVTARRQARVRTNVRRSSTNSSGCSIAAKWPPRGMSAQCVTWYLRSTHARGSRSGSFGYARDPGRDRHVRQRLGRDACLPVQPHRRRDGAGHPVDRHVREQLVAGERPLGVAVAVAPRAELLQDPREQPGRRVGERGADGLGLRSLLERVARFLGPEVCERREIGPLGLVELHRLGGRLREGHVHVDRRAVLRIPRADTRRDLRAPIAALRDVARVAEP